MVIGIFIIRIFTTSYLINVAFQVVGSRMRGQRIENENLSSTLTLLAESKNYQQIKFSRTVSCQ